MTLKEVKETLQTWIATADDEYDREEMGRVCGLKEALHEINKIDACEDTISRQAAIDAIENEQKKIMRSDLDIDQAKFSAMSEIRALIEELPSVSMEKPKIDWIPVNERLPENGCFVIVTIKDESGDSLYLYSDFGWYLDKAACWIIDAEQRTDIIAWMPLPAPYDPQERSKKG